MTEPLTEGSLYTIFKVVKLRGKTPQRICERSIYWKHGNPIPEDLLDPRTHVKGVGTYVYEYDKDYEDNILHEVINCKAILA